MGVMPLKLKPFVSAGEVFLHEDGTTFEVAPLSLFRLKDGAMVLRVGRNTYWFDPDGTYDGPECYMVALPGAASLSDEEILRRFLRRAKPLTNALTRCKHNRHKRPKTAYFDPGTPGYEGETAIWPKKPNKKRTTTKKRSTR